MERLDLLYGLVLSEYWYIEMKTKKKKDLLIILIIYVFAFIIGYLPCTSFTNMMLKLFVFDVVATVVTFIFSVILRNSSVYDAYWSATPMVMIIWLFIVEKAFNGMQIVFLIVFLVWSVRLTVNWVQVFTDFSYEDWRYRKFRDETPRLFWPIVNFFGIHFMPTLVVFAGMLPLFSISQTPIGVMAMPGIIVMLFGILLEFFADIQMHEFLSSGRTGEVCNVGLWSYSRHPNYLGEISFWCGVFIAMIPYDIGHWYYGIGWLSVCILFNVVSIPLMEKRQLSRRPKYNDYKLKTSRLILRPPLS